MPLIRKIQIQDDTGVYVNVRVFYNQKDRFHLRDQPAGWPQFVADSEGALVAEYEKHFKALRNQSTEQFLFIELNIDTPKDRGHWHEQLSLKVGGRLLACLQNTAGQVKWMECGPSINYGPLPLDWEGPEPGEWRGYQWKDNGGWENKSYNERQKVPYTPESAAALNDIYSAYISLGEKVARWRDESLGAGKVLAGGLALPPANKE